MPPPSTLRPPPHPFPLPPPHPTLRGEPWLQSGQLLLNPSIPKFKKYIVPNFQREMHTVSEVLRIGRQKYNHLSSEL